MSSVISITKDGRLTELCIKEYSVDTLFRRAGFKQPAGFGEQFRWHDNIGGEPCTVIAFGKTAGRALQKNAFRVPEAIAGSIGRPLESAGDRPMFFGNIILVAMAGDALLGLKKDAMAQAMASWILSPEPPPSADASGGARAADESPRRPLEISLGADPSASRPPPAHLGGASIRRAASKAAIVHEVKNCFDCSVELTEEAYI